MLLLRNLWHMHEPAMLVYPRLLQRHREEMLPRKQRLQLRQPRRGVCELRYGYDLHLRLVHLGPPVQTRLHVHRPWQTHPAQQIPSSR